MSAGRSVARNGRNGSGPDAAVRSSSQVANRLSEIEHRIETNESGKQNVDKAGEHGFRVVIC